MITKQQLQEIYAQHQARVTSLYRATSIYLFKTHYSYELEYGNYIELSRSETKSGHEEIISW